MTNIHASSGIRTHDPSNQAANALERAATGIDSGTTHKQYPDLSKTFIYKILDGSEVW
jgi:hypothetical protein